jgi:hypothetical protein
MSAVVAEARPNLVERIAHRLEHVRFGVARTQEEREEVFKMRYEGYRRDNPIPVSFSRRFADDFDDVENVWIFTVRIEDALVATFRIHVLSPEHPVSPALQVYPELIRPFIDKGQVLVEGSKFVVDPVAAKAYPELPYITLRMPVVASEHFTADQTLATVRTHHQSFYKRIFQHKAISEPREFPFIGGPVVLMTTPFQEIKQGLYERYPFFQSTARERELLFGPAPLRERPAASTPKLVQMK